MRFSFILKRAPAEVVNSKHLRWVQSAFYLKIIFEVAIMSREGIEGKIWKGRPALAPAPK